MAKCRLVSISLISVPGKVSANTIGSNFWAHRRDDD